MTTELIIGSILSVVFFVVGSWLGLSAWLARSALVSIRDKYDSKIAELEKNLARKDECLKHIELNAAADSVNLETWKLKYATEYGQLTGKVTSLESMLSVQLDRLAVNVQTLLVKMGGVEAQLKMARDGDK